MLILLDGADVLFEGLVVYLIEAVAHHICHQVAFPRDPALLDVVAYFGQTFVLVDGEPDAGREDIGGVGNGIIVDPVVRGAGYL